MSYPDVGNRPAGLGNIVGMPFYRFMTFISLLHINTIGTGASKANLTSIDSTDEGGRWQPFVYEQYKKGWRHVVENVLVWGCTAH